MERILVTEWLDVLPPEDARAARSRLDLRRVNRLMGHARIFAGVFTAQPREQPAARLVELGAGDGTFLLGLARRLAGRTPPRSAVLVDRQRLTTPQTLEGFNQLGWQVEVVTADVFEWLAGPPEPEGTFLLANLFLHHFQGEPLERLLRLSSVHCCGFAACEPRRAGWPLLASRALGLIGCNDVTRHDAVASVRAGFNGTELTSCWPREGAWTLSERPVGLFSHAFLARRTPTPAAQGPALSLSKGAER